MRQIGYTHMPVVFPVQCTSEATPVTAKKWYQKDTVSSTYALTMRKDMKKKSTLPK